MKYILVADDNPMTNVLITRELQKNGYGVLMAHDVVHASMALTRSRVDVVIVDVRMPGGSAFDVIRRMKHSTRLGPIPIIAISSGMTQELAADLVRHGADRCMKKPVDLDALQATIKELLWAQEAKLGQRPDTPPPTIYGRGGIEPEIVEPLRIGRIDRHDEGARLPK
jgi:DNA-binding response OmpR family regulator